MKKNCLPGKTDNSSLLLVMIDLLIVLAFIIYSVAAGFLMQWKASRRPYPVLAANRIS